MELFDVAVDWQIGVQVAVSALFVLLMSAGKFLVKSPAIARSERESIALVTFTLRHDPRIASLGDIVPGHADVLPGLDAVFEEDKTTPSTHYATALVSALKVILLLPVATAESVAERLRRARSRQHLLESTAWREVSVGEGVLLLFAAGVWATAASAVEHVSVEGTIVFGVFAVAGALAALAALSLDIWSQLRWKDYWGDELLLIEVSATRRGEDGVADRAMTMRRDVRAQPLVPIAGTLRLYLAAFAGVHAVIVGLFELFE